MRTTPTSPSPSSPGYDPAAMSPGQGRSGPRPTRARRRSAFAKRLTAERLRRNLPQRSAAELVGVRLITWQRWEGGVAEPVAGPIRAAVERFLRGE